MAFFLIEMWFEIFITCIRFKAKCIYNLPMNRLFLGRHGRDKYDDVLEKSVLSPDGMADSHRLVDRLREAEFTQGIILSSPIERALATARIVRHELGVPTLVRSEMIAKAGLHPEPVRDVRDFIGQVLTGCEVDHTDTDIMVVTHAPLVKAVSGGSVEYGEIYPVQPGAPNPEFRPAFEFLMERPDLWRL